MEDIEEEPVMDIDSCDKKNQLAVVEYIDDLYACYRRAEVRVSQTRHTPCLKHKPPVLVFVLVLFCSFMSLCLIKMFLPAGFWLCPTKLHGSPSRY